MPPFFFWLLGGSKRAESNRSLVGTPTAMEKRTCAGNNGPWNTTKKEKERKLIGEQKRGKNFFFLLSGAAKNVATSFFLAAWQALSCCAAEVGTQKWDYLMPYRMAALPFALGSLRRFLSLPTTLYSVHDTTAAEQTIGPQCQLEWPNTRIVRHRGRHAMVDCLVKKQAPFFQVILLLRCVWFPFPPPCCCAPVADLI